MKTDLFYSCRSWTSIKENLKISKNFQNYDCPSPLGIKMSDSLHHSLLKLLWHCWSIVNILFVVPSKEMGIFGSDTNRSWADACNRSKSRLWQVTRFLNRTCRLCFVLPRRPWREYLRGFVFVFHFDRTKKTCWKTLSPRISDQVDEIHFCLNFYHKRDQTNSTIKISNKTTRFLGVWRKCLATDRLRLQPRFHFGMIICIIHNWLFLQMWIILGQIKKESWLASFFSDFDGRADGFHFYISYFLWKT